MTLEALEKAKKVIGVKQVIKSVNKGSAVCVFMASDADEHVVEQLREACNQNNVEMVETVTMAELGKACAIEVGAAAAAAVK